MEYWTAFMTMGLDRTYHAHQFIFSFSFTSLFIPCGRLSWLSVSFLLPVKYTVSYRIVQFHIVHAVDVRTLPCCRSSQSASSIDSTFDTVFAMPSRSSGLTHRSAMRRASSKICRSARSPTTICITLFPNHQLLLIPYIIKMLLIYIKNDAHHKRYTHCHVMNIFFRYRLHFLQSMLREREQVLNGTSAQKQAIQCHSR